MLRRSEVVLGEKRARQSKQVAKATLTRSESIELMTDKLGTASIHDSDVESETESEKPRRSNRSRKSPIDPYIPSEHSTPLKRKRLMKQSKRNKASTIDTVEKKRTKTRVPSPMKKLNVEGVALPGREPEFTEICTKLSSAIKSGQGMCLYLSGVPGTGKTATVKECIGALQKVRQTSNFDFIELNGMKLSDPGQLYSVLWRHLGQHDRQISPHQALKQLKAYFSDSPRPVVVLLDELDALIHRKQSILYHLFEWTGLESAKLVIIAIANTMDLPERLLSNRIASRMGLNRINFKPYQYSQLQAIIQHRLKPYKNWFHVDALELCGRKVSSVSGDARRAISFATRAIDYIVAQSKLDGRVKAPTDNSISLQIMSRVLETAFTGTPVWAIKNCTGLQLIMLESIAHAWKHQIDAGSTTFNNVQSIKSFIAY